MIRQVTRRPRFEWVGGRSCLDFTNTVAWPRGEQANERLANYGDLLEWAYATAIIDAATVRRLRRAARAAPAAAQATLQNARALREAIYQVFVARVEGHDAEPGAAMMLNRFLGQALGRLRLQVEDNGFTREVEGQVNAHACLKGNGDAFFQLLLPRLSAH